MGEGKEGMGRKEGERREGSGRADGESAKVATVSVQVLVVAEMPLSGGFYMTQSVDTLRLHPYIDSHQLFYLAVQLVFLVFALVFAARTLRDLMTLGAGFYSTLRCWLDLGLAGASLLLVVAFVDYSLTLYDAVGRPDDMRYRRLFAASHLLRAADALVGLLAVLRALQLCRYVPLTSRLFAVLDRCSAHLVASVVGALLVWLCMAFSAAAISGHDRLQVNRSHTRLTDLFPGLPR